MDRINSIRHEKLPSKRWSMIKDTGCMGPAPAPIVASNKNIISISLLPYNNNQDCIVDNSSVSKKSISSRKIESLKKVQIESRNHHDKAE